jgi:hypothetical protein
MSEKLNQLKGIIKEAVSEVLKEVLVAPVDKDPEMMSNDEKKQALQKTKQSAGVSDPDEPIDFIKKEQKTRLREMPRTPILYRLPSDWEDKLKAAPINSDHQNWYNSPARLKWIQGIVDFLKRQTRRSRRYINC